jgi:hypothetical protein
MKDGNFPILSPERVVFFLLILFSAFIVWGIFQIFHKKVTKQNQILDRMDHLEGYLREVRDKRYTLTDQDINAIIEELSQISDRDIW